MEELVQVLACDGRIFQGTLKSFDQRMNVILADCNEHTYISDQEPMQITPLGAYLIRGDNLALVSKVEVRVKEGDVFGCPVLPMQL